MSPQWEATCVNISGKLKWYVYELVGEAVAAVAAVANNAYARGRLSVKS